MNGTQSIGKKSGLKKAVIGILAIALLCISQYLFFHFGRKFERLSWQHPIAESFNQSKKPISVPLFIDPHLVRQRPRFLFSYDATGSLADIRQATGIDAVVENGSTELQKINLWLNWVKAQWEPGRPDPYPPLNAKIILKQIRQGVTGGFCAQYNYVFVQGLQSIGYFARYVTIVNHEVTEVWLNSQKKWICCDPLYRCFYQNDRGEPLSVYEIFKSVKLGSKINIIGDQLIKDIARHFQQFRNFAVWLKNDHITSPINFSDIDRYKVYFVETVQERFSIPISALFTPYPEDLYQPPISGTD